MKLRKYLITDMTKFTKKQKEDLCHNILNILADPDAARLLKKTQCDPESENITITKEEARHILDNLKRIRKIILDLPIEE